MDDRSDFDEFDVTPELRASHAAALKDGKGARPQTEFRFVKLPEVWIEKLKGASGSTYGVAHFLLSQVRPARKRGEGVRPVYLSAVSAEALGLSKTRKNVALRDLVKRGLVELEPREGKSLDSHSTGSKVDVRLEVGELDEEELA